jgi:excisionase family DNA binding protein
MSIPETVVPTEAEQAVARDSSHRLADTLELHMRRGPQQDELVLVPARIARLFRHILVLFAQGKAVTIVPNEAMLTTQDAADFLHVSRPFLVKLLGEHNVQIQKVGNRRKIPFKEVERLQGILQTNSRAALSKLAQLDRELELE